MLRHPASYAHRTFAFNAHLNADGTRNEAYVHATATIDERRILTGYRDLRDPLHLAQGGTLGRVHKNMTLIQLVGRIQAPDATQAASLSDRERELLAAFDPYLCYLDSPTTEGAYALDFTEPTTDTTTYPTGLIPLRYYCRPTERPMMTERIGEDGWRNYSLALVAPDPRVYEQTLGEAYMTSGLGWTKSVVNKGTVPGPLRATILMSGAGASNFTLTAYSTAFVLNLSGLSNGNQVIVTFETCGPFGRGKRVTVNGTDAFSRKTSSASTWLVAPPGTTSFVATNTTNVSECYLEWGHAWA